MSNETNPAETSGQVVLNPHRFSPSEAIVALLDALGAKNYTLEQVPTFLGVRDQIVNGVRKAAQKQGSSIQVKNFRIFVFNDTVVFAYLQRRGVSTCSMNFAV